jgi:hypothetical protein
MNSAAMVGEGRIWPAVELLEFYSELSAMDGADCGAISRCRRDHRDQLDILDFVRAVATTVAASPPSASTAGTV